MAIRKPPFDDTAIRPAALSEAEIGAHTPMMQQGANQLLRGF